jgi:hypothetical protein
LVRDGAQRLVLTQNGGSNNSKQEQEEEEKKGNSPEPEGIPEEKPDPPSPSNLESCAISMERLVQRDECGRGIAPIVESVGKGVLAKSARSLFSAKRVLILTGFPCLLNAPSPQETDGPPGAVAIARACVALGKRVSFVVEEPIADVIRASIAQVFPKAKTMLLRSHGMTRIESFGAKGQVSLEVFPTQNGFKEGHYQRLDEILTELAAEEGHMIAIERAGPAHDGRCRTMRARVMDGTLLAPLHVLFERAKERKIATTGIGDGGNEVGMGAAYEVVKAKMGETIACVTSCDFLIASSVSNWGGHALCAALALVALERQAIQGNDKAAELCVGEDRIHLEIVEAGIRAGAADGITSQRDVPSVDGLPFSKTLEVIHGLRKLVLDFKPGQ